MTDIGRTVASRSMHDAREQDAAEKSFNDKVLHFIEQNKPQGSLTELMDQLRELSPDKALSLQQLNTALLYSNTHLRNTEEAKEYTDRVLDKHTCQMLGLNMFYNEMLYKIFTRTDDDSSF